MGHAYKDTVKADTLLEIETFTKPSAPMEDLDKAFDQATEIASLSKTNELASPSFADDHGIFATPALRESLLLKPSYTLLNAKDKESGEISEDQSPGNDLRIDLIQHSHRRVYHQDTEFDDQSIRDYATENPNFDRLENRISPLRFQASSISPMRKPDFKNSAKSPGSFRHVQRSPSPVSFRGRSRSPAPFIRSDVFPERTTSRDCNNLYNNLTSERTSKSRSQAARAFDSQSEREKQYSSEPPVVVRYGRPPSESPEPRVVIRYGRPPSESPEPRVVIRYGRPPTESPEPPVLVRYCRPPSESPERYGNIRYRSRSPPSAMPYSSARQQSPDQYKHRRTRSPSPEEWTIVRYVVTKDFPDFERRSVSKEPSPAPSYRDKHLLDSNSRHRTLTLHSEDPRRMHNRRSISPDFTPRAFSQERSPVIVRYVTRSPSPLLDSKFPDLENSLSKSSYATKEYRKSAYNYSSAPREEADFAPEASSLPLQTSSLTHQSATREAEPAKPESNYVNPQFTHRNDNMYNSGSFRVQPSNLCNDFKNSGECRFGDNCKFSHGPISEAVIKVPRYLLDMLCGRCSDIMQRYLNSVHRTDIKLAGCTLGHSNTGTHDSTDTNENIAVVLFLMNTLCADCNVIVQNYLDAIKSDIKLEPAIKPATSFESYPPSKYTANSTMSYSTNSSYLPKFSTQKFHPESNESQSELADIVSHVFNLPLEVSKFVKKRCEPRSPPLRGKIKTKKRFTNMSDGVVEVEGEGYVKPKLQKEKDNIVKKKRRLGKAKLLGVSYDDIESAKSSRKVSCISNEEDEYNIHTRPISPFDEHGDKLKKNTKLLMKESEDLIVQASSHLDVSGKPLTKPVKILLNKPVKILLKKPVATIKTPDKLSIKPVKNIEKPATSSVKAKANSQTNPSKKATKITSTKKAHLIEDVNPITDSALIQPAPIVVDGEEWFEVDFIINHRTIKPHSRQYFVRWKGYPPEYDTWEPADELEASSPDIVTAYARQKRFKWQK